jgi:ankyrin repeat protein
VQEGDSALHMAAKSGALGIVYALLDAGADASLSNKVGGCTGSVQMGTKWVRVGGNNFVLDQKVRNVNSSNMHIRLTECTAVYRLVVK